jgi:hypothetical protein
MVYELANAPTSAVRAIDPGGFKDAVENVTDEFQCH